MQPFSIKTGVRKSFEQVCVHNHNTTKLNSALSCSITSSLSFICLHLVLKCVSVIRIQVDSWEKTPFTPVSTMRLQGVQLTTCLQMSLLPMSLSQEGQRASRTVITSVCRQTSNRFVSHKLAKKTQMFQDLIYMSLSGTHHDTSAFTLQKTRGQMRPRPPRQVVWVIGSQCVLVVVGGVNWVISLLDLEWSDEPNLFLGINIKIIIILRPNWKLIQLKLLLSQNLMQVVYFCM